MISIYSGELVQNSSQCEPSFLKATSVSSELFTQYFKNGFYIAGEIQCWKISSNDNRIVLSVSDSKLEFQTNCLSDYGIIYDGGTGNSPVLKRWCGDEKGFKVITTGKEAYIEFVSNENDILGRGFRLRYYSVLSVTENDNESTRKPDTRENIKFNVSFIVVCTIGGCVALIPSIFCFYEVCKALAEENEKSFCENFTVNIRIDCNNRCNWFNCFNRPAHN